MNETLVKLVTDYRDTHRQLRNEKLQRQKIEQSKDFVSLQEAIDDLTNAQNKLLSVVPDSSEEHEMDRAELLRYLNDQRMTTLDGFDLKIRQSKSVNTTKVLRALDGDLDQFFTIASVTQKALKEYGELHPELKKMFKECVEFDTATVTGLVPLEES